LILDVIPAWPETLIEPTDSELVRWVQLWRRPQAAVWARTGQEHTVATLVRLEQRCDPRRPSAPCDAELGRLRRQLGVDTQSW
jgi:hypothetical protein